MGQLVLLVVAAAWAAVLLPPLLRSRIENRPNSSVTDFRNQLSSLQRAMPARGVAMRSMARPLASSPLSRPAAPGRPSFHGLNGHGRVHGGASVRANGQHASLHPVERRRRPEPVRTYDATPRSRRHAEAVARPLNPRDVAKRRRANVLFVLALIGASSLFLAATTRSQPMVWVAVGAIVVLFGYVCLLGQLRQRALFEPPPMPRPAPAPPAPAVRRQAVSSPALGGRIVRPRQAPAPTRGVVVRRPPDRWSHAV